MLDGVRVVQELVAGRWMTKVEGRLYLNQSFPGDATGSLLHELSTCMCPECGLGYAERMIANDGGACVECRLERVAEASMRLEREGIPLGWGYCGRDASCIRQDYQREQALYMGWRQRHASSIDQRQL